MTRKRIVILCIVVAAISLACGTIANHLLLRWVGSLMPPTPTPPYFMIT